MEKNNTTFLSTEQTDTSIGLKEQVWNLKTSDYLSSYFIAFVPGFQSIAKRDDDKKDCLTIKFIILCGNNR